MKSNTKLLIAAGSISLGLILLLILFPDLRENRNAAEKIVMALPFFTIVTYSLIYAIIHAVKKLRGTTEDDVDFSGSEQKQA